MSSREVTEYRESSHHGEKEARRHLWLGRARIEHRGRGMREPALRHEVVSLDGRIDVVHVDTKRYTHQHVLRPFDNLYRSRHAFER